MKTQAFTKNRVIRRSGGGANHTLVKFAGTNCSTFCALRMGFGGACWAIPTFNDSLKCDPHHIKCCDSFSSAPLNSRRVAYASQIGTNEIDPTLSMMNITDVYNCWRMIVFFFKIHRENSYLKIPKLW